jgi:hypothetical protein
MANGEDLVYDWQYNVVDEPTEWGFNWEYAECGTPEPTPRANHATLWLVMNADGATPIAALRAFFAGVQKVHPAIKFKVGNVRNENNDYELSVINKRTKAGLWKGTMVDRSTASDGSDLDPNVGNYAVFLCTNGEGVDLMKKIVGGGGCNNNNYGTMALIPHERVEIRLENDYKVVSVTGTGPDDDNTDGSSCGSNLATRFALFHGGGDEEEEVARCHLSYRDGSWDPSLGPTIEMLAVKQSSRGQGLARVLWYWVRRHIEDHFMVECLNNDAPLRHTMIKATQIGQSEVEIIRMEKDKDSTMYPLGFKQFLFDYCGFSVRQQKGAAAYILGSRRPKDEEAVLYVPLVDPTTLASRKKQLLQAAGTGSTTIIIRDGPKPGNAYMRERCGARMCHWCTNVAVDLLRCARCGVAFYCDPTCQKKDWKPRHKRWCNKTREQVREILVKEGNMIQQSDGTYSLMMNGPGRTFGDLGF